jgi:hypothetical protein
LARWHGKQGAVITHPERCVPRRPFEEGFNQIKLTHKRKHKLKHRRRLCRPSKYSRPQNATIQP